MTGPSAASVRAWKDGAQALAGVVVVIYFALHALQWLTGGVQPKEQVQVDQLSQQLTQAQAQFTQQITGVQGQLTDLTKAFGEQARHVDQRIGDMDERFGRDELSINSVMEKNVAVGDRVTRLENGTSVPVRQPR